MHKEKIREYDASGFVFLSQKNNYLKDIFLSFLFILIFKKVISATSEGLELMILRSRVICSTN